MSVTVTQRATVAQTEEPQRLQLKQKQFPDINTIRNAIPPHCFQPSTLRSLSYVARDVTVAAALWWAAVTYIPQLPDVASRTAAWMVYGFVQGLFGVGIWILAHEAGHGAFSTHEKLNNFVGWALHSALLVPYFSWKFSHHRHHRFTGHMEKDMAFVPNTAADRAKPGLLGRIGQSLGISFDPELMEDVPIANLVRLVSHQLFGWQAYLLFNVTSGKDSLQRKAPWYRQSHFEPTSAVFRDSEAFFVFLTDVGLAITAAAIWYGASKVGWDTMFLLYAVPYFWVHHWLIAITYLHHTHHDVPHYDAASWTFVKGAVATVDRDFGFIGRHIFHGIIETHVTHHLFPRIPFYKADEATEAIKPVLGDLYFQDNRPFLVALWSTFTTCKYVERDPKVPGAMKWAD